jgi:hypothetical protein
MKSPTVTFRISPLLLAAARAALERYNRNPQTEPLDMTGLCNIAISDKIAHWDRSRKKRRGKLREPKRAQ